jgi:hypothetical protein
MDEDNVLVLQERKGYAAMIETLLEMAEKSFKS